MHLWRLCALSDVANKNLSILPASFSSCNKHTCLWNSLWLAIWTVFFLLNSTPHQRVLTLNWLHHFQSGCRWNRFLRCSKILRCSSAVSTWRTWREQPFNRLQPLHYRWKYTFDFVKWDDIETLFPPNEAQVKALIASDHRMKVDQ